MRRVANRRPRGKELPSEGVNIGMDPEPIARCRQLRTQTSGARTKREIIPRHQAPGRAWYTQVYNSLDARPPPVRGLIYSAVGCSPGPALMQVLLYPRHVCKSLAWSSGLTQQKTPTFRPPSPSRPRYRLDCVDNRLGALVDCKIHEICTRLQSGGVDNNSQEDHLAA